MSGSQGAVKKVKKAKAPGNERRSRSRSRSDRSNGSVSGENSGSYSDDSQVYGDNRRNRSTTVSRINRELRQTIDEKDRQINEISSRMVAMEAQMNEMINANANGAAGWSMPINTESNIAAQQDGIMGEWQVVKPRDQRSELKTANRYEVLEVEPMGEEKEMEVVEPEDNNEVEYIVPKKRSWMQQKEAAQQDDGKEEGARGRVAGQKGETIKGDDRRRMPFVFSKVNTRRLIDDLKSNNIIPDIRQNGEEIKVMYPETERETMLKIAKEQRAVGYTFMAKEERIYKKILVGVPNSFNIEEVKEDIMERMSGTEVTEEDFVVERLTTYHSKTNGLRLGKLVVKAKKEEILELITGLNSVCYSRIRWLEVRKQEITQCHNCMKFGHSISGGCLYKRQCKACPEQGISHKCEVKKRPMTDVRGKPQNVYADFLCINCNQKGHPATYSRCPARLALLEKIEDNRIRRARDIARQEREKMKRIDAPLPNVNAWEERTKKSSVRNNRRDDNKERQEESEEEEGNRRSEEKPKKRTKKEDIFAKAERVLGISADEMEEITDDFIEEYEACTTVGDKRKAYAKYFLSIRKWQP